MNILEHNKTYEYKSKKICFRDNYEFENELRQIRMSKLLHLVSEVPDATNDKMYVRVYYEIETTRIV